MTATMAVVRKNISMNNNELDDDSGRTTHEHEPYNLTSMHSWVRCVTYPFARLFGADAPLQAVGLAVDIFARATIGMSSMFLGPALLELASKAAGCPVIDDDDIDVPECTLKIHGFQPSSLLANIGVVSGLLGSITLPVFGSVVDHTPYRRQIGAITAACVTTIKAIEIGIGPRTWFIVAALQILASFCFNFHLTATYAYLSELSNDFAKQSEYNSSLYSTMYISTIIFLVSVSGWSFYFGTDDIGTARISQTITTLTCTTGFFIAWMFLFRNCPALSKVPHGTNLVSCGFRKVFQTFRTTIAEYPTLALLMISVSFSEAASMAIITISTTYMKIYLRMNSGQRKFLESVFISCFGLNRNSVIRAVSIVFLSVLLSGVPGSLIGNFFTKLFRNPITSIICCDLFFIISTLMATFILTGPEDKDKVIYFGIFWGIGLGWLHPQHTTAFVTLIPKGQDAELMGTFLFSTAVLTWMPPLVFTIINEMGYPMTYGLGSLCLFFAVGLICLLLIGCCGNGARAVPIANTTSYELVSTPEACQSKRNEILVVDGATPVLAGVIT